MYFSSLFKLYPVEKKMETANFSQQRKASLKLVKVPLKHFTISCKLAVIYFHNIHLFFGDILIIFHQNF